MRMRSTCRDRSWVLGVVLLLCAGLVSCVGTPQPIPPNVVEIDPEEVFNEPANWGGVDIFGNPGAVSPPEAILWVWDLDTTTPPDEGLVDPDGGFHIEATGVYGDEFRLQAILGEDRSPPLDIVVVQYSVTPAPRPLSCLTTSPELQMEVIEGQTASLEIINDCDQAVTLGAVSLRYAPTPFTIVEAPSELAARTSAAITLEYAPDHGIDVEILMIDISAPDVDRRPVTLIGVSP